MTDDEEKISEKLYMQLTQLGHFFHRFYHKNRKIFKKETIPQSQGILLKILLKKDGLSNKGIVKLMDIRPSSVGELVGKLEKRGYVRRKIDPNDKRSSLIFLTDKGKSAEKSFNVQNRMMNSLFHGITKEEQKQLSIILERVINPISDDFKSNDPNKILHSNYNHSLFDFLHCENKK